MKEFKLEPDNRDCPDDVLLADLSAVASRHSGKLTRDIYNREGRFAGATIQKRFGSWNKALVLAGLEVGKRSSIPDEELLEDIQRIASQLRTTSLSVEDYRGHGKFSPETVQRRFGSWERPLRILGLTPSEQWRSRVPDQDLLANLGDVWRQLGRQPKQKDCRAPLSRFAHDVYVRRFGSWRRALEKFVETANQTETAPSTIVAPTRISISENGVSTAATSTPRDPSWKLRFLVHRRDNFTCKACGRSPATELGVVLHVDHVVPWSKGGQTVRDNLQTLCERCNIGKSDRAMTE